MPVRGDKRVGTLDQRVERPPGEQGARRPVGLAAGEEGSGHGGSSGGTGGRRDELDGRGALARRQAQCLEIGHLPRDRLKRATGPAEQPMRAHGAEPAVPVVDENRYPSHDHPPMGPSQRSTDVERMSP